MKPISYKQETGDTERLLCLGSPQVLLGFNPLFSLILLNLEENRCWTRKEIIILDRDVSTEKLHAT